MSLAVNHGSLRSFNYCKDRKKMVTVKSSRISLSPCHELPSGGIALSCQRETSIGFSAKSGEDLNSNARIWKGPRWGEIATRDGSMVLRLRRRGSFCKGTDIRGLGFSQEAKMSLDRRKEQLRKRGRRKPQLKPDDVHVTTGYWRLFGVEVVLDKDLGKDNYSISDSILEAIAFALKCTAAQLPKSAFSVVRKSLDARKFPRFVYTVDLDVEKFLQYEAEAKTILSFLRDMPGKAEFWPSQRSPLDLVARLQDLKAAGHSEGSGSGSHDEGVTYTSKELLKTPSSSLEWSSAVKKAKVAVVGSGPAGLFAALSLAEANVEVVLVERGQPVESRGRHIGALMVRRILDPNSNLCFGEGGAGTWSDGKLTTRIGKNGSSVQTVLATLVRFGAPPQILIDGKPHLGTDRLIRILQNLRSHLLGLGAILLVMSSTCLFITTLQ